MTLHLTEDTKEQIRSQSKEQFEQFLIPLSALELIHLLIFLQNSQEANLQTKLEQCFHFFNQPLTLEKIGSTLTPQVFIAILDVLIEHSPSPSPLSSLLTTLPPLVFLSSFAHFNQSHMELFKQESLLEPFHYHLSLFIHEIEKTLSTLDQEIRSLDKQILSSSNLQEETTVKTLLYRLKELEMTISEKMTLLDKIMPLVWLTNRADFVEKISHAKESFQFVINHTIGKPPTINRKATGLYLLLNEKCSEIFTGLLDEDFSLEGLTRFSIWHLQDYFELGLLPFFSTKEQLESKLNDLDEKERNDYQQSLRALAQEELNQFTISTIRELKLNYIFSKEALAHHIEEFHQKIISHH